MAEIRSADITTELRYMTALGYDKDEDIIYAGDIQGTVAMFEKVNETYEEEVILLPNT